MRYFQLANGMVVRKFKRKEKMVGGGGGFG